ncbi:hypothetical protein [Marinobacter sp. ATCH36]|uniref:hypothetical protein n=1 Tax=Marinobacter sp. ATCH36 TaxID=2945106 RepID=UPI00201FC61C|nr:hypothetical protein [Marinobacter sp. ATCH36]MCL7944675.1 hypothetical protein [Marinobacter sp. ATCH36]
MAPELDYITVSREDLRDLNQAGIGKDVIASLIHDWAHSISLRRKLKIKGPVLDLQVKFKRLSDESLVTQQVAELLGISPSRVRQLSTPDEPGLYVLVGLNEQRRYPPWQFQDGGRLPHLQQLLKAIRRDAHPFTVCHFMTTKTHDLESGKTGWLRSPREWLIAGNEPEPVLQLARNL